MKKVDIFQSDVMTYQVRTKSAAMLIEFDDAIKESIFKDIVLFCDSENLTLVSEIKERLMLSGKYPEHEIDAVIEQLNQHELFDAIAEKESSTDIHNTSENKKIVVIGDGKLSGKIYNLLMEHSFVHIQQLKFEQIIKDESIIKDSDFMLVDCTCFNPLALRIINKTSIANNTPWLHIGGFENEQIKLGPIFFGKESGCYECLERRKMSNLENPKYDQEFVRYLIGTKQSSHSDSIPLEDFHLNFLANWCVIEMFRFFEDKKLLPTWRGIISFDLYKYGVERSELLRNPFCPVCRPLQKNTFSPWLDPKIVEVK